MPLPRSPTSLLLAAAAAAVLALTGAPPSASAAAPPADPDRPTNTIEGENGATIVGDGARDAPRHVRIAQRLWDEAWLATISAHPCCDRVVGEPPVWSEGAPDAGMLATLPVLQRPATPADRLPPELRAELGAYLGWTRAVRLADGRDVFIVPAPDFPRDYLPTPCRRLLHVSLQRRLEGHRRVVRRAARRIERHMNRGLYRPERIRRVETVRAVAGDGDGGTPAIPLPTLRHQGAYAVIPRRSGDRHLVVGLVPAGVTQVRMRFASYREGIPGAPGRLTVTRTPVVGVLAFELERGAVDARLVRVVWQHADGSRATACDLSCI